MSNFLILVSDKKVSNETLLKDVDIPKEVSEVVGFSPQYAYAVYPVADIEKTEEAKNFAPEFYAQTCEFFNSIYETIKEIHKQGGKVAMMETYIGEDLSQVIWEKKEFPKENFLNDLLEFDFETIYEIT